MLINNLLYANPNTSSNPVCVLKSLISSCSSFQSQKCVSIPLSISWKLPHAPKGSPVPLICLNYSHCAAVRQVSPKHPRKRTWCFQCQMNVRPEWKQHRRFSLTSLIKNGPCSPAFLRYHIWILNSHGFQCKLETLMPPGTEILHSSSKHHIQAGITDDERQEKMLLLLPHLNWDTLEHTPSKYWVNRYSPSSCQPFSAAFWKIRDVSIKCKPACCSVQCLNIG